MSLDSSSEYDFSKVQMTEDSNDILSTRELYVFYPDAFKGRGAYVGPIEDMLALKEYNKQYMNNGASIEHTRTGIEFRRYLSNIGNDSR